MLTKCEPTTYDWVGKVTQPTQQRSGEGQREPLLVEERSVQADFVRSSLFPTVNLFEANFGPSDCRKTRPLISALAWLVPRTLGLTKGARAATERDNALSARGDRNEEIRWRSEVAKDNRCAVGSQLN